MNEKDRQLRRNNVRRLFRHTSGIHVNCVRLNIHNSLAHEAMKFNLCYGLAMIGHDFIKSLARKPTNLFVGGIAFCNSLHHYA